MTQQSELPLKILARLGAEPAISFYEDNVAGAVEAVLREANLRGQIDAYGNILARLPGRRPEVPPIALVAHLDHPGFEAVAAEGENLVGQARGGVPAGGFKAGVPLLVLLPGGRRLPAVTVGPRGAEADREVLIRLAQPQSISLPAAVVFDLPDFSLDGDFIRMRALDDLSGCAGALAALIALAEDPPAGDVYGLFTRAEEVGLVGARLAAEARLLPLDTLVVSLEASRTLPGAEQGSGPVIRVGDAGCTFSADAEAALIRARETLQARPEGFKVQRQLMSGGSCEATAFAHYGYRTTGVAFPLGNYHNGAPDGSIQAEHIHLADFLGGVTLAAEAARLVAERGQIAARRRLQTIPDGYRGRLRRQG